jgi:glutamine synthetase
MKPREVLALCREKEVKAIDLRFTDFLGAWQHFTIPVAKLEEDTFEDGLGFDGSSIRGWQAVNESDMLLVPVPTTAFVDPFASIPTLVMICMVQDPITREEHRHRRHLLHRPRGRVLRVRRRAVRPERPRGLLPPRQRRGGVESGPP